MLALLTWTLYAGGLYVLWSGVFRLRHGRWPMAYAMPPRDRYTWIDMGLSASMWAYFAWCVWLAWPDMQDMAKAPSLAEARKALPRTPLEWAGLIVIVLGSCLRVWTLLVLGPNWRMGQDATDTRHEFVKAGPYRFMDHPINAATAMVGLGQVGVTSGAWAAWGLLGVTIAYYLLQGAAEVAFWKARNRA